MYYWSNFLYGVISALVMYAGIIFCFIYLIASLVCRFINKEKLKISKSLKIWIKSEQRRNYSLIKKKKIFKKRKSFLKRNKSYFEGENYCLCNIRLSPNGANGALLDSKSLYDQSCNEAVLSSWVAPQGKILDGYNTKYDGSGFSVYRYWNMEEVLSIIPKQNVPDWLTSRCFISLSENDILYAHWVDGETVGQFSEFKALLDSLTPQEESYRIQLTGDCAGELKEIADCLREHNDIKVELYFYSLNWNHLKDSDNHIKEIPEYLFYKCDNLVKVVYDDVLDVIGDMAFAECSNLKNEFQWRN